MVSFADYTNLPLTVGSVLQEHYTVFDESVDMEALTAIHDHVRREIEGELR